VCFEIINNFSKYFIIIVTLFRKKEKSTQKEGKLTPRPKNNKNKKFYFTAKISVFIFKYYLS
jgi:hypothetical protein